MILITPGRYQRIDNYNRAVDLATEIRESSVVGKIFRQNRIA